MKITVIIITKNEENQIRDCIESVSFADEVLIIDSQSTDKTAQIAKQLGATVKSIEFADFAKTRNYALEFVNNDWVLYVDADERVNKSLEHEIKRSINQKDNNYTAYKIQRKNYYFGNHQWPYIEKHVRLFKKNALQGWSGAVHESPHFSGKVGELDGYLLHYTHKNLSLMVQKTNIWSDVEAKLLYEANHPHMVWWRFLRIMATKFLDSYINQGGWKVGRFGFIESMYQAYSYFIVYAKLWEIQVSDPNNKNVTHPNDPNIKQTS